MNDLEGFVDSLSDEQFRLLWKWAAIGSTNTREFWLTLFLACQRRVVGCSNAVWAANLAMDKERKDNEHR